MNKHLAVKRSLFCFLICIVLLTQLVPAFSEESSSTIEVSDFRLCVNNDHVVTDWPIIKSGTEFLTSLRIFAEQMGLNAGWNVENQQIILSTQENTLIMTIGSNQYYLNNVEGTMPVAPVVYNNFAYVPIKVVAESFGYYVTFDYTNKLINVDTANTYRLTALSDSYRILPSSPTKIEVRLTDKDGNGIPNQMVEWSCSIFPVYIESSTSYTNNEGYSYVNAHIPFDIGIDENGYIEATSCGQKCVIDIHAYSSAFPSPPQSPTPTPTLTTPTPTQTATATPSFVYGDLNGDRDIDSTDITILKRCLLGISVIIENEEACDLNNDAQTDSTDLTLLKRLVLKIITYNDLLDIQFKTNSRALSINFNSAMGRIKVNDMDIYMSTILYFPVNEEVTIRAIPYMGPYSGSGPILINSFDGWSGDIVSNEQPLVIKMDKDIEIYAKFSYPE